MDRTCNIKVYIQNQIEQVLRNSDSHSELSETDTQVIFVEPLLWLAKYNIFDTQCVKRAKREPRVSENFDIKVYKNEGNNPKSLHLCIEVKSLNSPEFPDINSERKIERKEKSNNIGNKEIIGYTGDILWNGENITYCFSHDGVGQLFGYVMEHLRNEEQININEEGITINSTNNSLNTQMTKKTIPIHIQFSQMENTS